MKKILIILIFDFIFYIPIKAQKWLHTISYGVKVGYTMSGIYRPANAKSLNVYQSGSDIYHGYEMGAFLIYRPFNNWEVIGEILYRKSGSSNYFERGLESGSVPYIGYRDSKNLLTFNSIIFPLSIGYRTTKWKVNPYINIGIVQSYIMSGHYKGTYNWNRVIQSNFDENLLLDSDKRPTVRRSLLWQGSLGVRIMNKFTIGFTITEGKEWVYPIFDRGTALATYEVPWFVTSNHEMSKTIFIQYHIK
jgi:hypothetical protein